MIPSERDRPDFHPGITQEVAPDESQRGPKATTSEALILEAWTTLILFGERRLLHVLKEFVAHYHEDAVGSARVRCRERLGVLLRYYYQAA